MCAFNWERRRRLICSLSLIFSFVFAGFLSDKWNSLCRSREMHHIDDRYPLGSSSSAFHPSAVRSKSRRRSNVPRREMNEMFLSTLDPPRRPEPNARLLSPPVLFSTDTHTRCLLSDGRWFVLLFAFVCCPFESSRPNLVDPLDFTGERSRDEQEFPSRNLRTTSSDAGETTNPTAPIDGQWRRTMVSSATISGRAETSLCERRTTRRSNDDTLQLWWIFLRCVETSHRTAPSRTFVIEIRSVSEGERVSDQATIAILQVHLLKRVWPVGRRFDLELRCIFVQPINRWWSPLSLCIPLRYRWGMFLVRLRHFVRVRQRSNLPHRRRKLANNSFSPICPILMILPRLAPWLHHHHRRQFLFLPLLLLLLEFNPVRLFGRQSNYKIKFLVVEVRWVKCATPFHRPKPSRSSSLSLILNIVSRVGIIIIHSSLPMIFSKCFVRNRMWRMFRRTSSIRRHRRLSVIRLRRRRRATCRANPFICSWIGRSSTWFSFPIRSTSRFCLICKRLWIWSASQVKSFLFSK